MSTYALCLGVNQYREPIDGLRCAEADARELAAVFKQKLGFEAAYLEEREAAKIMQRIEDLGPRLRAGDQFIFYFSGHGKVQQDEQFFLLPQTRLNLLEKGAATEVLSWQALQEITTGPAWQDVVRIFIFDACRHPLLASKGAGEVASFDGRILLRAPIPSGDSTHPQSPWGLLNSCNEGKSAAELPALGHGVFTLALLEYLQDTAGRSSQLRFNNEFAAQLKLRMQRLGREHGLPEMHQEPVWRGETLAIPLNASRGGTSAGPSARTRDEREWQLLLLEPKLEGLEAYVRNAADDAAHVDEALQMIAGIKRQMQDEENWRRVQGSKKWEDWAAYLQKAAPDSVHREEAERNFAQLKGRAKRWQEMRKTGGGVLLAGVLGLGGWWFWPKSVPVEITAPAEFPATPAPAAGAEAASVSASGSAPAASAPAPRELTALEKLKLAAEKGEAQAQYELARKLSTGDGVDKDETAAVGWYTKAAEQNHVDAQVDLGYMYNRGLGTKQNYPESAKWYRKAAEQGDADGQSNLGIMYENGRGVEKNLKAAVKWYEKSAAQRNSDGQNNLGRMYEKGWGVEKNIKTAVQWYEKSAAQGNQHGQYNLALMYEYGYGVQPDLAKAKDLYRQATAQGFELAKAALQRLEKAAP